MTTVKFGYWTVEVDEEITTPWLKNRYVCSQCGNWQTYGRTPFCPNCGAKMTMTNGDRIRAMMDEELAEWIHTHIDCEPTCPCFDACHKEYEGEAEKYFIYTPCEQKLLEWLKQEVKDG